MAGFQLKERPFRILFYPIGSRVVIRDTWKCAIVKDFWYGKKDQRLYLLDEDPEIEYVHQQLRAANGLDVVFEMVP